MTTLGLFAKHPVPGRVKTRLGRSLGDARAAELYAAFVADLAARFARVADRRVLAYAPDDSDARAYFAEVAQASYELWPQPGGDLGERLKRFFASHDGHVVVLGSDSPSLPTALLREAFELLERHDCVLGPATDGGYYLIGLSGSRAREADLFDEIAWSTGTVLAQTVAAAERSGLTLALLPPWYDVDTEDDLQLLTGHCRALRLAGDDPALPETARVLNWRVTERPASL
jgi:rSAM/selenodomain-associated transferase 1